MLDYDGLVLQVSIQYVADETGFHATGSHVPQVCESKIAKTLSTHQCCFFCFNCLSSLDPVSSFADNVLVVLYWLDCWFMLYVRFAIFTQF